MNDRSLMSRRGFLRQACAAGAFLAAASSGMTLVPGISYATPSRSGKETTEQQTRLLMGTFVTLTVVTQDKAAAQDAMTAAFAEIERLCAVFDRHSDSSALSQLNASGSMTGTPEELYRVLRESERIGQLTGHAFNPAITPVVDLFGAARSRSSLPSFSDKDLRNALALSAPAQITASGGTLRLPREGMRITLDGIAKGFIADAASAVLADAGMANHMVNAGGDISVRGHSGAGKPWQVGVRYPGNAGAMLGSSLITSGGIATSGSYEQNYNRSGSRNHLISHLTGKSSDVLSVTVKAATAMRADALATALAVIPAVEGMRLMRSPEEACLIVDRHGRRYASDRWA